MAGAINGEARTGLAVLETRLTDCQGQEAEFRRHNREEHDEMFSRLRALEVELARLTTRVAFWAAVGAAVAAAAMQLAIRYIAP
jgi:uncharacterized protein (DUF1786 family)